MQEEKVILLHKKGIMSIYGLSDYEAQTIMDRLPKINIGRGEIRPRWVVKQDDVDTYLHKKQESKEFIGIDRHGKILRKR